jgi:hypothetical protein
MHSTFLFFIFLICCMLGEAKVLSHCWLRMLCITTIGMAFWDDLLIIIVTNHSWSHLFFFKVVMLTPSLPHMHPFQFSDTCNLGSKGSIKF